MSVLTESFTERLRSKRNNIYDYYRVQCGLVLSGAAKLGKV